MDEVPARPAAAPGAIPGDPVAIEAGDPPQLLHVEMEPLAWVPAGVAARRLLGVQALESAESAPLQHPRHRGARQLEARGDARPRHPRLPQPHDAGDVVDRQCRRTRLGPRGPVPQPGRSLPGVAGDPLVGGPRTDPGCLSNGGDPPTVADPFDQKGSTCGAGACSTVEVHPGLLAVG